MRSWSRRAREKLRGVRERRADVQGQTEDHMRFEREERFRLEPLILIFAG